jgi:hypothetical protein
MGGTATMLSTPDVLARRDYIYSLLGDKARDEAFMRVRPATHERIIRHLGIVPYGGAGWCDAEELGDDVNREVGENGKKRAKSMRTKEGRRLYADRGLRREWEAMGMEGGGELTVPEKGSMRNQGGMSRESAIELD